MLLIALSNTEISQYGNSNTEKKQTGYGVHLVLTHEMILEEDSKRQLSSICSIGFKSGDLAGNFIHSKDTVIFKIVLYMYNSVSLGITIHQNELIINNNGIGTDKLIKDLVPVSHTNNSSSKEHL
ncbi:hypothetical protein TNCV_4477651 [Trichonephila clavipes]|nr:hypothetical protein TNCV_4477651 [Trichonephila clavipes]